MKVFELENVKKEAKKTKENTRTFTFYFFSSHFYFFLSIKHI